MFEFDDEGRIVFPQGSIRLATSVIPIPVRRKIEESDEELAPGMSIVGTYLGDKLIARCAVDIESDESQWDEEDQKLLTGGVAFRYVGQVTPDGIEAHLFAIIPAERLLEPWQELPEPTEDDSPEVLMYLGKVVRVKDDLVGDGSDPLLECVSHVHAILAGPVVPVVERLLDTIK
jgi:hypothetical protein